MAIPLHLWLTDGDGTPVQGSSQVAGREGSIEVLSFLHSIHQPADQNTGRLTGRRSHQPIVIEKELDKSSPVLYLAVARGLTLKAAEFKWYRTNEAGREEEYFNTSLLNVKIVSVSPRVPNIKDVQSQHLNHFETVELIYEEIRWAWLDGNLICKDGWNMVW